MDLDSTGLRNKMTPSEDIARKNVNSLSTSGRHTITLNGTN